MTSIILLFLFFSCSQDEIPAESNSTSNIKTENVVPEILGEYIDSKNKFVFEQQTIYSKNKKSYIKIYLCSYDINHINSFKKTAHFELSTMSKEKIKASQNINNEKENQNYTESEPMDFWVEIGEKHSENSESALILNKIFDTRNARFRPNYANFDYYVDSDNEIGVYRLPANNSDSDVNCEFFLKHGWLGAWYHQITINLVENWQSFNFNPADAYKVRVNVRHNWNNYNIFNY